MPVSLLSQMKKNYIERLKEYEGRTSLSSKRALYSKQFLKNCYQQDKENLQTTRTASQKARNSNSQKRHKDCKALAERQRAAKVSQREEQANIEINPYSCQLHPLHSWDKLFLVESPEGRRIVCEQCSLAFLSKTVFLEREDARQEHERLADLRVQLVRLQRLLQEKAEQEAQNCRKYYRFLRGQLEIMQAQSISYIRQSYLRSKKTIEHSNENISRIFSFHNSTNPPQIKDFAEVQIELAVVQSSDQILENARKYLRQLDLRTLAFLQPPSPPLANEKEYSTKQTRRPSDCELSCSQKIEKEGGRPGQNEISFHCQRFAGGWQADLAEHNGCTEVSPSFKLF